MSEYNFNSCQFSRDWSMPRNEGKGCRRPLWGSRFQHHPHFLHSSEGAAQPRPATTRTLWWLFLLPARGLHSTHPGKRWNYPVGEDRGWDGATQGAKARDNGSVWVCDPVPRESGPATGSVLLLCGSRWRQRTAPDVRSEEMWCPCSMAARLHCQLPTSGPSRISQEPIMIRSVVLMCYVSMN